LEDHGRLLPITETVWPTILVARGPLSSDGDRLRHPAAAGRENFPRIPHEFLKPASSLDFRDRLSLSSCTGAVPGHGHRRKGNIMPLVDIQLIEGVFTPEQKKAMIEKVTDTMVSIEGETMRGVTWVRVHELGSGEWGIGGKALTTADVKALQSNGG
jgi:4-oxalocrotonate tautomerase